MKNRIDSVVKILLGALVLMMISFYNGYPLVYSDTGTYLYSGFDKFIPVDRPIPYGLFVCLFSFKYSLWWVVIIQNLITSFVVYELCKLLIKRKNLDVFFLGILLFLTLFTGIGWYTNQIMPDFFTPVFLMILFLLLYLPKPPFFKLVLLSLIFIFSLIVHFSHFFIASVLFGSWLAIEYLISRRSNRNFILSKKRLFVVAGLVVSAWIILPSINYLVEKKFVIAKGSHAFLMAHFADSGSLSVFLKEHCDMQSYKDCKLCNFKDSIPQDLASFLWEEDGVFQKTGGWSNSKSEYEKVIQDMMGSPKFLLMNLYKSMLYGSQQIFRNEIGQGLTPYTRGSAPYGQISWRFPHELNNYLNARQNLWNGVNLNFSRLNLVNLLIHILSLFMLVFLFFTSVWRRMDQLSLRFLVFSLLAIFVNAFMTAGLNAPCERFQARVVWLLPFSLILVILNHFVKDKPFKFLP